MTIQETYNNGYEFSEDLLSKSMSPQAVMEKMEMDVGKHAHDRPTWGRSMEFLMSCLSLSVGLGNIWRFPYVCYENGGAAFLIPYLIILFFIGKPFYFLEMVLGQFTSKGSMKAIQVVPLMKGIGWGQQIGSAAITTYYTAIIGLTLSYLIRSFSTDLPWSTCYNYSEPCIAAESLDKINENETKLSSAELFFTREVLQKKDDISDGIGGIVWSFAFCLMISWICVYLSIIKGIKTSGKLAYVFAILPYVILLSLFAFALKLEGAWNGIKFFIVPDFWKILDPLVWYNACTQCFYSLTIGMGCIIMFSSYNRFDHNIYRDVTILSIMDTFTSILGGFTIFAILGNLAHNIDEKDVRKVVKETFGLAFISYPEAIAKIKKSLDNAWIIPQIMAIVFFGMLFVLGVGSTVGLMNNISTNLKDYFPKTKYWIFAGICSLFGLSFGILYTTNGGIHMIGLVDYFGGQFLIFALATAELVGIIWIYGLQNFCWDIEFMLKRKMSPYWRICWSILMPVFMLTCCVYLAFNMENPKSLPYFALFGGWTLFIFGCSQIVFCSFYLYITKRKNFNDISFMKYLISPNEEWGPQSIFMKTEWRHFKDEKVKARNLIVANYQQSWLTQKLWELMGKY